jgi:hypothetical protein
MPAGCILQCECITCSVQKKQQPLGMIPVPCRVLLHCHYSTYSMEEPNTEVTCLFCTCAGPAFPTQGLDQHQVPLGCTRHHGNPTHWLLLHAQR